MIWKTITWFVERVRKAKRAKWKLNKDDRRMRKMMEWNKKKSAINVNDERKKFASTSCVQSILQLSCKYLRIGSDKTLS